MRKMLQTQKEAVCEAKGRSYLEQNLAIDNVLDHADYMHRVIAEF